LGGQSLVVLADPSPTQLYTLSLHDALPIFTEHLERWGYLSSNELAVQLGVHRSTVVRFAQHIGFPGYPGLQEAARAEYLRSLSRSEEHTSELQSRENLVCRLLLEKTPSVYE